MEYAVQPPWLPIVPPYRVKQSVAPIFRHADLRPSLKYEALSISLCNITSYQVNHVYFSGSSCMECKTDALTTTLQRWNAQSHPMLSYIAVYSEWHVDECSKFSLLQIPAEVKPGSMRYESEQPPYRLNRTENSVQHAYTKRWIVQNGPVGST
ncbi:hypothetical protein TMatcc_010069 [Talaromyces marneffei ATCC 18224]